MLSEVFRGKLLATLEAALDNGTLRARPGDDPRGLLTRSACTPWVVYCKPPFAGAEQVLACLGRYAHRIAISNDRLVARQDGHERCDPGDVAVGAINDRSVKPN